MGIVAACGLFLGWIRIHDPRILPYDLTVHSKWIWLLVPSTTFALTAASGPTIRGIKARAVIAILAAVALGASLYLMWAHIRSTYFLVWLGRGFPYPDPWLTAMERWFDARYPLSSRGSLKTHREWPRVTFVVGASATAFAALAGHLAGLLIPKPGRRAQ